jgi:hypothetical protein
MISPGIRTLPMRDWLTVAAQRRIFTGLPLGMIAHGNFACLIPEIMLTLPPNSSGWHILRYIMVMRNLLAISLVCVAGVASASTADFIDSARISWGAGSVLPAPYTTTDIAVTIRATVLIGPFPVAQSFTETTTIPESAITKSSGSLNFQISPQSLTPLGPTSPLLTLTGTSVNASTAKWTFSQLYSQTGGWAINQTVTGPTGPVQINLTINNITISGKLQTQFSSLPNDRFIGVLGQNVRRTGVDLGGNTENLIDIVPSSVSGTIAGLTATALRVELRSIKHVMHVESRRKIQANLSLLNDVSGITNRTASYRLSATPGGAALQEGSVPMTGNSFTIPAQVPAGNYHYSVKVGSWLSKGWAISVPASGTVPVSGSLINGDVDLDNEVGPGDFEAVVSQFGGAGSADLDGDGEVGPSDFEIVVGNFGLQGD